ncbi:MAG: hypothetical protein OEM58_07215 [Nitrospirota bacterium]|nr:hypothetical protein [Nitrospirota bacterium]
MSSTKVICRSILILLLLGLPPLGIVLSGQALPNDWTLLPIPLQAGDASLSWPIFGLLALLISGTLAPFLWRYGKTRCHSTFKSDSAEGFPWWGWMGVGWTAFAWVFAWTRFSWFQAWQPYTFPLLWFGYIVVINALLFSRTGQCMLVNQPKFLFKLFVLSAGFWWMFEYLNQFVHNWHYVGMTEVHAVTTVSWMTLAFSTVLPAVLGTYEYISSFRQLKAPLENWHVVPTVDNPRTGWLLISLGCLGLLLIGMWPTVLFPLLWIAPLLIILGIKIIRRDPTVLTPLTKGNWSPVGLSAMAALVCGGFWEMWNAYSLVHWEYSIPYVHAFKIFEMPILGYAGYLPFGLECVAVTELFLGVLPWNLAWPGSSDRMPPAARLEPSLRDSHSTSQRL